MQLKNLDIEVISYEPLMIKEMIKKGALLYANFLFRLLRPSREKRARAVRILEANCDSRCQHWCTALVHSPRPVLTERAALEARRCLHR